MSTGPSMLLRAGGWSAVTALVVCGSFVVLVLAGTVALLYLTAEKASPEAALSLVFVAAAVVLILVVCTLSIVFRRLGIHDRDEAMGLPTGSVRAVISLLLIMLFFIAAIFLFNSTRNTASAGGTETERTLQGVDASRLALIPTEQIRSLSAQGEGRYEVVLYPPSTSTATSDDIAKQLITTVGTLVTAVAAFYFGANSVTTARRIEIDRTRRIAAEAVGGGDGGAAAAAAAAGVAGAEVTAQPGPPAGAPRAAPSQQEPPPPADQQEPPSR